MNIPRISACTAICLLIIAGMLVVSCSDDDKSVTPTPEYGWSPLGTGMHGYDVSALTVFDNTLIAGGLFDSAGGVSVHNIAAWDGTSWASVGGGLDERHRLPRGIGACARDDRHTARKLMAIAKGGGRPVAGRRGGEPACVHSPSANPHAIAGAGGHDVRPRSDGDTRRCELPIDPRSERPP